MPAVSIIIPVYNVAPYMARCARSLFGQTLQDLEFVFVDDASTDGSLAVLEAVLAEFPARKSQVRIHRMPFNSGQAQVRMQALSMVTGEYVYHCDSDDEIEPDTCQGLYEKAVAEDLDIVTCNFRKEDAAGRWQEVCGACPGVEALLRDTAPPNLVCRLVRRSLFSEVVQPVADVGEDMMLTIQVTLRAARSGHVDRTFYHYRYREASTSKAPGREAAVARWKALQQNVAVLLPVLYDAGFQPDAPAILHFKYNSRHHLEPFVGDRDVYRLWRETFPEIDRQLLFTPGIPLEKKGWFLLIRMHLFRPVKRLTRRLP